MGFSKNPVKSKMAEIHHLENRHDVIFLPWAVWIKFGRLVQNDMPTAIFFFSYACHLPFVLCKTAYGLESV